MAHMQVSYRAKGGRVTISLVGVEIGKMVEGIRPGTEERG